MKKAKLIKVNEKQEKQNEKESYSLKNLLLIIIVLVITFGLFYLITALVVKPIPNNDETSTITEIDSTKIILNQLLDKKEKEYYVLATKTEKNSKTNYAELYNNYISKYNTGEKNLTFYSVDLNDALNKNYLSDELNISNEVNEIKLNDEVLFKIKNGKIEEYFVGSKSILKALSNL